MLENFLPIFLKCRILHVQGVYLQIFRWKTPYLGPRQDLALTVRKDLGLAPTEGGPSFYKTLDPHHSFSSNQSTIFSNYLVAHSQPMCVVNVVEFCAVLVTGLACLLVHLCKYFFCTLFIFSLPLNSCCPIAKFCCILPFLLKMYPV